ncbi:site-2 protease family protein [Streptomyces sp. NPDC006458]|uniref:site-2 protease family protein n=1 Tax=Streptomyces sp. NPDC006458 TaxID=3154302 RepID=UPI0033BA9234
MDESGGSGRPRPDDTETAEHQPNHRTPPSTPTDPVAPTPTEPAPQPAANASDGEREPAQDQLSGDAATAAEREPAQDRPSEDPAPTPEDSEPAAEADEPEPPKPTTEPQPAKPAAESPEKPETDKSEKPAAEKPADKSPETDSEPVKPTAGPESESEPDPVPHAHRTLAHTESAPEHRRGTEPTPAHRHGTRPATDPGKGQPPKRQREPGGGILMGRPFGVPVYVAPSWFLVAALITWVFGGQLDRVLPELGGARYLVSLFFAVAFYASVLVHELAHTVAALRFKLPVRRIQLQFFGGVSEIEKEAETPGREFWLAFVGPLLSLVLAGVFYAAVQTVEPGTVPGVLLAGLMISNLIVAAFNLLPGLPLDGGRMLRAVVWKITGKPMSGTVAAAWVGRALAVAVLIGLPLLTQSGVLGTDAVDNVGMDTVMDALLAAILAAIIWTGAGNSLRVARLREHLPELRARALTRRAVPVESDTPLSEALRRANAAGARALVVVDPDGHPVSLVREAAIVGVPEHRRPWVAVSGLAQDLTDGMRVSAELAGEDLLDVLRATPATEYLVVEDTGEIYGVLSAADVERAFVKAMARPS